MYKRLALISAFMASIALSTTTLPGCTKKPSQEELSKLDENRQAAESAEKKLAELRRERQQLESQLSQKQGELNQSQSERDSLQRQMKK